MEPAPVSTEVKPLPSFESEVIEGPIVPKPKSKLPLILAGIVVVAAIAGASFLVGFQSGLTQMPPTTPTSAPALTTPTPTPDPTADWKTYRNEKFRFEFKYPYIFILSEYSFSDENIPVAYVQLAPANKKLTPEDNQLRIDIYSNYNQLKNLAKGEQQISEKIIVDGVEGLKYWWPRPDTFVTVTTVRIEKAPFTCEIDSTLDSDTFDQILSTFKFIN